MKRKTLLIAYVAIFLGTTILTSGCGSAKQTAHSKNDVQQNAQTQSSLIANKKQAMKDSIEMLKFQYQLDSAKRALNNASKQQAILEGTVISMPCSDAKPPAGYIKGYGMGEPGSGDNLFSTEVVYSNARAKAAADIAKNWLGVATNVITEYYARVKDPDETTKEKFERTVKVSNTKDIDKIMIDLCEPVFVKNNRGTYTCYLATMVPIEKIQEIIENNLNQSGIKVDRQALQKSFSVSKIIYKETTN